MSRRKHALAAAFTVSAVTITGCGGATAPAAHPTTSAAPTTAPAPAATSALTDAQACKAIAAYMHIHGAGVWPPQSQLDALANRVDPDSDPAVGDHAMAEQLQHGTGEQIANDCYVLGAPLPSVP